MNLKKQTRGRKSASSNASASRRSAETKARKDASKTKAAAEDSCVVVGVGASAGGLDAYKRFLEVIPSNSGLAFVFIQHLDPTHESLMADLLSKHTSMRVVQAEDGMQIRPNHVYMIPPKFYLRMDGGIFALDRPKERRGMRLPIDYFFRSLAEARKEQAVGVVLSGTGSDGSHGLQEIKAGGGMALAQKPETAEYGGMPRGAIATGIVDYVLAIEDMAKVIVQYARHPYVNRGSKASSWRQPEPDDFKPIINLLRVQTNFDFQCYKKGTLHRRIQRRMGIRQVRDAEDYLQLLRLDRTEVQHLFKDLLIGVTGFFRDKDPWIALGRDILKKLVKDKAKRDPIRVWVPGCSTGEEAYSLAILLFEECERQGIEFNLQLFATDIDAEAIEFARFGEYPPNAVKDIDSERLKRFFQQTGEHWRVNKKLREKCIFAVQNLVGDPPFSNLDLVSCRNVLIYLEQGIQNKVIRMFHFALNDGGCLMLGNSESVGNQAKLFDPVSKAWRIYRKSGTAQRNQPSFPIIPMAERVASEMAQHDETDLAFGPIELAKKMLIEKFAPASVLINEKGEIQYFHGPVRNFLDFPEGEPSNHLNDMVLEGLRHKLRAMIHQAAHRHQPASELVSRLNRRDMHVSVQVSVDPLPPNKGGEPLLLVTFADASKSDKDPAASSASGRGGKSGKKDSKPGGVKDGETRESAIQQLQCELQATREDLQSTIEELETSNEELKASNEEIMSMNEELQSANEELETSREELQSLNEELTTVNNQLEEKVQELELTNNDLTNLLTSTEIATIFLDTGFRIRRFTPVTKDFLHIIPTDVGRPVSDLAPRVNDPDLLTDAKLVLEKLTPVEKQVQNSDERWFVRRILPYRTSDNKINGVVVTLTDVTSLQRVTQKLRVRESQQSVIAELGREALGGISSKTLFDRAVRLTAETLEVEYCKVLQLLPNGKELLLAAGVGWREGLVGNAKVITGRNSQAGYTLRTEGPVIVENLAADKRFRGPKLLVDHGVVSGISAIIGQESEPWGVLGAHSKEQIKFTVDDIHFLQSVANLLSEAIERKRTVLSLQASEKRHRLVVDSLPILLAYCDHTLTFRFCNAAYERWFGLKRESIVGKKVRAVIGPKAFMRIEPRLKRVLEGEHVSFEDELYYKYGPMRHVKVDYIPDKDSQGLVRGYYAMIEETTERIQAARVQARLAAIVESSTDAIFSKSLEGVIQSWNRGAERLYGYTAEEAVGKHVSFLAPNERRSEIAEIMRRLREGEIIESFETLRRRKDGELIDISLTLSPIRDESGIVGVSTIARDITRFKQAERQLQSINETLEKKVDERTTLLRMLHRVTRECHSANSFDETLQFALIEFSQYAGCCFSQAFRPDPVDSNRLTPIADAYEETPGRFNRFLAADKKVPIRKGHCLPGTAWEAKKAVWLDNVWPEIRKRAKLTSDLKVKRALAFPIMLHDKTVAVLEFFFDEPAKPDRRLVEALNSISAQLSLVEERLRANDALRRSEGRMRRLVESNIACVFISDRNGNLLEANQAFLNLIGFNKQDLRKSGINWIRRIAPEFKDFEKQAVKEVVKNGILGPHEIELLSQTGERVSALIGMADLDRNGRLDELIAFMVDLTAIRRLERQILEISDLEKQRLGQDLHDSMGQHITGVKFRLSSLVKHLNRQSNSNAEEAGKILELISQMEQCAHDIAQGLVPIRNQPEGLASALEELAILMGNIYQRECRFKKNAKVLIADAHFSMHLYRIAQEATANAMKHAKPRRVEITLSARRGRPFLEIRDDGKGMPKAGKRSGGGLGLDIMAYRARLIGSELTIESAAGKGTVVSCLLPKTIAIKNP